MQNKTPFTELRDSALKNIDKHQLTPVPDNYRLWFEYAQGTIDTLNNEIDQIVNAQNDLNDSVCNELYHQFIASEDQQQIEKARLSIADMLQVMAGNIQRWDGSAIHFCDTLDQCASRLQQQPDIKEINNIVQEITDEAKKVRSTSSDIHNSLHSLTQEISNLRQDVDRLGQEALTDPLTQLANRRSLDNNLSQLLIEAQTTKKPLSVLMADIDHFKRINDSFGHNVGDKVIRFVATIISRCVRGNDFVARYGGEEFSIVLPNTNIEKARVVAENIRKTVSARQLTLGSADKILGHVTLSIGASQYQTGEEPEKFLDRADKAMYAAKDQGRDKVVCD